MVNLNNIDNMNDLELETHARRLLDNKEWDELKNLIDYCNNKDNNQKNFKYKILASEMEKLMNNIKNIK